MTAGGADAGGTWLPWHRYVLKFVLLYARPEFRDRQFNHYFFEVCKLR